MTEVKVSSPTDLFRLHGCVTIVTGASSGLGARFARVLHGAGATVVAAARRVDRLDALATDLGDRIVVAPFDIGVEKDCERVVAVALKAGGGRIDVLVNNAGAAHPWPAETEPIDHWHRVMDVNLNGLFVLTQMVARSMLAQGSGSIINVASILGLVASTPVKQASYSASKGAVVNLTRELAAQWARKGVRVNALAPGWFESEMTEVMTNDEASQTFVERNCPMGRFGDVAELDGALLYLASAASTYTTGHVLVVDGGWTAR